MAPVWLTIPIFWTRLFVASPNNRRKQSTDSTQTKLQINYTCKTFTYSHSLKTILLNNKYFFKISGKQKSGGDLVAITIQRSREHGIPGYNEFREFCGLKKAQSFDELTTEFDQKVCCPVRHQIIGIIKSFLLRNKGCRSTKESLQISGRYWPVHWLFVWKTFGLRVGSVDGTDCSLHHRQSIPENQKWRSFLLRYWQSAQLVYTR